MNKLIIASGPVIVEKGKVLLDKHGDDKFWKFCGGRVEGFEADLQSVAKARAKEELGIDIEISDGEPFLMHTAKETPDGKVDVILVHYNARYSGEVRPGADVKEWKWVALKDLEKEDLAPNIIPALVHFWYLDK